MSFWIAVAVNNPKTFFKQGDHPLTSLLGTRVRPTSLVFDGNFRDLSPLWPEKYECNVIKNE